MAGAVHDEDALPVLERAGVPGFTSRERSSTGGGQPHMPEWTLLDSSLLGGPSPSRWSGRMVPPGGSSDEVFLVSVEYAEGSKGGWDLPAWIEQVAEVGLNLPGLGGVRLAALVEEIPSMEAVHPPPVTVRFSFVLEGSRGLRVAREHVVRAWEEGFSPGDPQVCSDLLPPGARAHLDALRQGDRGYLEGTDVVALARWLAAHPGPLSPPQEEIRLSSLTAEVEGGRIRIAVESRPGLGLVAPVPAGTGAPVLLLPEYLHRRHVPYLGRLETQERPLPSYAVVKVSGEDGIPLAYGESRAEEGLFQVEGPATGGWRRARLEAAFPLEPPGLEPRSVVELRMPEGSGPGQGFGSGREAGLPEAVRTPTDERTVAPGAGEDEPEEGEHREGEPGAGTPGGERLRNRLFLTPQQGMPALWGERDDTGAVLGEIRRLYKAALLRGTEEIRGLDIPREEKAARMGAFLDRWRDYLLQSHKGGWLQDFVPEMDRDREEALRRVSAPL